MIVVDAIKQASLIISWLAVVHSVNGEPAPL